MGTIKGQSGVRQEKGRRGDLPETEGGSWEKEGDQEEGIAGWCSQAREQGQERAEGRRSIRGR